MSVALASLALATRVPSGTSRPAGMSAAIGPALADTRAAFDGLGALAALDWTRPYALLALVLPVCVLLLARRRPTPRPLATGTLDVWSRVGASGAPANDARRTIPPAVWLLASALVLGALALAEPRTAAPRAARTWRVVVDRSPSMYLDDGGATRLARALAAARAALTRTVASGDAVHWVEAGESPTVHAGAEPPQGWSEPPSIPRPDPEWSREDDPSTWWVTDRAPPTPRAAGVVASGGVTVPGPCAVEGTTRLDWDGKELVTLVGAAPVRSVEVVERASLAPLVADLFESWRRARGLAASGGGEASIRLRPATSGVARTVELARDGWSARGKARGAAASSDEHGALATWLAAHEETSTPRSIDVVTYGPGRIECALADLDEPAGDAAALAVSWARLFDAALLAPPGVVALAERRAAGEPLVRDPRGADAGVAHAGPARLPVALAACAFLLASLALLVARERGERASTR